MIGGTGGVATRARGLRGMQRSSGSRTECCSSYGVALLIVVLVAFALTMSLTSLVVAAFAAPTL